VPEREIAGWLLGRIRENGAKPFLTRGGESWTYADLSVRIEEMGREISGGVAPGDCVAVLGDYSLTSFAALFWLFANGNIVVPVAPAGEIDLPDRLDAARCDWLLRAEGKKENFLEQLPRAGARHDLVEGLRACGHAGLVLFSSGSTGKPKAMIHDLDRLISGYRDRKPRALSLIVFLMFDHIGGLNTAFNAVSTGSHMIVPVVRDADEVAALIEHHRISILPTSPTFLNLLLIADAHRRFDLSSLRIITYGTEPMPESLLRKLKEALPKVKLLQTFGTSETGISRTESKSSGSLFMKLDDPDIEHKVVEGELWLKSKSQILGYLNHDMDSFTADGWFRTGDQVEVDPEGFIRIVGRTKEIINVGGEKVLPAEIESVLLEMPEIADCVVYGEVSSITGQMVCARVVLSDKGSATTIKSAVRAFCSARLARYKVPVKVIVAESGLHGGRFKKKRMVG